MDVQSSDIHFLLEKVKKRNYRKFLIGLRMHSVRSFTNQYIEFKFPITAVIGTNGGGKSTILGSAALAYKSVKPGDFFPKSNISDNSMANWKIEYDLIDRSNNKEEFQTNARFVSARWRREKAPEREVIVIPIQRTVPANEIAKFKKFIGTTQLLDIDTIDIDTSVIRIVSRILSKDVSGYKRIFLKNDSSKSILTGIKRHNDYSQFHFGAGEASIIEMVTKLEGAQEEALVLIEEIENGLHPLATEKMVEYLFDVAKRKKCQVIFTTHSENAISKLPSEGIWACIDGRAYNGKLSIESLRALTGSVEKNKVIFVEDEFAKDFCEELLRQYASEVMEQIEVHKAGGYPHVVNVMKFHNQDPSNKSEAIALIDGDVQSECNDQNIVRLPDNPPEQLVFGWICENVDSVSSLIQQRCHCPAVPQDRIVEYVHKVQIDTTDHHLYFKKIGEFLNYSSELVVRRAFCSIYVEKNADLLLPVVKAVKERFSLGTEAEYAG